MEDLSGACRSWWVGDGASDAFDLVWRMQESERERLPDLFRALVDTVPTDRSISYIGIAIVESLMMPVPSHDRLSAPEVMALLLQAELDPEQIRLLLSGMYSEYLDQFKGLI